MLTQDDIIYFVVTDRFSNGDPDNDFDVQPSNPRGFHGGDFQGIIDRIPYLQHLGVTALWITPVFENKHLDQHGSFGYHGYWPLDFEKVDPHLYSPKPGLAPGSKRYLKDLVDQLHAVGIKVVLDMVVNHTAYGHPGLENDPSTPIRSHWFNPDRPEHEVGPIGSWLAGLPDLNLELPEVADYFARVIGDWIEETGVDCIRMDTARHVENIFWFYYKTVVQSRFPQVTLLGEVLDFNIDAISRFQQHFAFDSLFDFPLQKAIEDVVIYGASASRISAPYSTLVSPGDGVLDRDTTYTNHNRLVTLLDNHDLRARYYTLALEHSGGNREWAMQTNLLAITLLMTSRGIPQIYYGTELALEGGADPDNRRDMPWHTVPGGLEPSEDFYEAHTTYHHLRQLIGLRKASPALRYGSQLTLYVDDSLYVFVREWRDEWIIVALNLSNEDLVEPITISFADNTLLPPRLKDQMANERFVDVFRQVPSGQMKDMTLTLSMTKRSASLLMPLKQVIARMS